MALAGALQVNTMLEELDLGETDLVSTCTFSGGRWYSMNVWWGGGGAQGGGTLDFKWQGWSNGGKNQNLKKFLDQNLTPKKSCAEFLSRKNLLSELRGRDM